jgi:drug/metabolite transporter (DMT)-like permease
MGAGSDERGVRTARLRSPSLLLATAILLTSFNYSVMKVGLAEFDPLVFSVLRFGPGGLVLLAFVCLRERSFVRPSRRDLPLFVLVGLVGVALQQGTLAYAVAGAGAANSAMFAAAVPIITSTMAALMAFERFGRRHWVALFLGLTGVALIVEPAAQAGTPGTVAGDAFGLVNAVIASAASFPIAILLRRCSAAVVLAYEMLIGTALLVPIALPALAAAPYTAVDVAGWGALVYGIFVSGIAAALLYFTAMRQVGPSRASLFQYLAAPLAVGFAVVLVGDRVTPLQLLGGAIVLLSVGLSARRSRPEAHLSAPAEIARTRYFWKMR